MNKPHDRYNEMRPGFYTTSSTSASRLRSLLRRAGCNASQFSHCSAVCRSRGLVAHRKQEIQTSLPKKCSQRSVRGDVCVSSIHRKESICIQPGLHHSCAHRPVAGERHSFFPSCIDDSQLQRRLRRTFFTSFRSEETLVLKDV